MKCNWQKITAIIVFILILSACSPLPNTSKGSEKAPDMAQKAINATPIVSSGDLSGIWTGCETTEAGHIGYLYFCSNGVYYMASKVGKPSSNDFTSNYRVASSYSISVNSSGETVCEFGGYSAKVYSKTSLSFRGDSYKK